jgi:hypothetical protein
VIAGIAAATLIGSGCLPALAQASDYGIEVNGAYRVTSLGDWAKTNDVFIDEKTVVQTWTVSSSCQSPMDCTGEIRSDQGWTARLRFQTSRWIAEREVPNWVPCPDGTAAPGLQKFVFWGTDERGQNIAANTDHMAGWDDTTGPSGACGVNKPVVIWMPLRLDRI